MNELILPDTAFIHQLPEHRQLMYEPRDVNRRLTDAGGVNLFGDPLFRVVWGWSALEDLWSAKVRGFEKRLKYFTKPNRWVLEAWHEPYMSRAAWEEMSRATMDGHAVELLAEYPSRGEYDMVITVEGPHKKTCETSVPDAGGDGNCVCGGAQFAPLTADFCEYVIGLARESKKVSAADRRNWFYEQDKKRRRDFDRLADDMIQDAGTPFGGNKHWVPMHGQSPNYNPDSPTFQA